MSKRKQPDVDENVTGQKAVSGRSLLPNKKSDTSSAVAAPAENVKAAAADAAACAAAASCENPTEDKQDIAVGGASASASAAAAADAWAPDIAVGGVSAADAGAPGVVVQCRLPLLRPLIAEMRQCVGPHTDSRLIDQCKLRMF
jgi:hypothetical protein